MSKRISKRREKFYDDEIAPALAALAKKCTDNGLSLLSVVEFNRNDASESEYGRTVGFTNEASDSIRWMDVFVRCNANFERYALAFKKHVVQSGLPHSSIYLEMLGVNCDPERRT